MSPKADGTCEEDAEPRDDQGNAMSGTEASSRLKVRKRAGLRC